MRYSSFITFALPLAVALGALALPACDAGGGSQAGAEIRAQLEGASVSLTEAIALAEAEVEGGVTIEASLEESAGESQFVIEQFDGAATQQVSIGLTGASVGSVEPGEADATEAAQAAADMEGSSLTPEEVIAIAEAEVDGEAFEFEIEDGEFEVELVTPDDKIFEVTIALDGSVTEVEEEDDEDEDDEDGEDGEDADAGA